MAVVANASLAGLGPNSSPHSLISSMIHSPSIPPALHFSRKRALCACTFALKKSNLCVNEEKNVAILDESSETLLYSFSPLSLLLFAALPGGNAFLHFHLPFLQFSLLCSLICVSLYYLYLFWVFCWYFPAMEMRLFKVPCNKIFSCWKWKLWAARIN